MSIKSIEKMDGYNATEYVNNSEPDLDAENLNKTENKIKETVAKANEIIDTLNTLISKTEQELAQLNSNIPSKAFTINAGMVADILDTRNKSGVYSTDSKTLHTPISTYGRAIISKNEDGGWVYVEFIPTDISAIYYNFYNGYAKSVGWSGWKKTLLTS